MNQILLNKLLFTQAKRKIEIQIRVAGTSMNPTLYEGDSITIKQFDDYNIGDILVFTYKSDELLVHRLLKKTDCKYFCKGDNSFRLEDITIDQIVGKVIQINNAPLQFCSARLITLSYLVNHAFIKCRYNIEKTKQTSIYKLYQKSILRKEESLMIYKKNEDLDYVQADETSLAVFDPETGNTHFFDETGIDILNILSEPCDLDILLQKLCEIYNTTPQKIKADVEEFLAKTTEKKVIKIL